jgi:hypothetical protein
MQLLALDTPAQRESVSTLHCNVGLIAGIATDFGGGFGGGGLEAQEIWTGKRGAQPGGEFTKS